MAGEVFSLLSVAAESGDLTFVRRLLEQGADKDEVTNLGRTSMWHAALNNHLPVVRYLAEQGADMEKASYGWTPLIIASYKGHLEVVRYLLEQGANRDKAINTSETSLHLAAEEGHLETAKLLMIYGADLNARTKNGELPIDIADNEEIKQAIRDEPRRRMDHGHKRATEQDRHPNTYSSASSQQEDEDEEEGQIIKKPRLDVGAEAVEGKVADEDQDSEPSSNEEDD